MTIADTVALLGGTPVFGRSIESELDLAAEVVRGFRAESLDHVLQHLQSETISPSSIYALVGTSCALQRTASWWWSPSSALWAEPPSLGIH